MEKWANTHRQVKKKGQPENKMLDSADTQGNKN